MAKHLSASLQGATSTPGVGPVITGLIVGGVAAALPAVNGLILGAAGLGGIGLGVAGQLHDPKVRAAIDDMGAYLGAELHKETEAFRDPLVRAAGSFGAALGQALDILHLDRLAGVLEPLAGGLGGLATNMAPGFAHALEASEPVVRELAQELPEVGRAFGDMFDSIAEGGPGAEEALRTTLMLLEGLARGTGLAVEGFSNLYHGVVRVEDNFATWVDSWQHSIPVIGAVADHTKGFLDHIRYGSGDVVTFGKTLYTAAEQAEQKYQELAAAISQTQVTGDSLAGMMAQKLFTTTMNMDEATLHWHESLANLNDTLKQHHLDLRETTKDGEANREAVLSAVQANMAQYQAFIAVGGSAQDAAGKYDENTRALEAQLRQSGLTQGAIDDLIGKYRGIPDTVNTRIQTEGIESAISRLDTLMRRINGLPYSKEVHVNAYIAVGEAIGHHASGGSAWGTFEVGEQGREYVTLPSMAGPAYVTPNSTINGAANSSGGSRVGSANITLNFTGMGGGMGAGEGMAVMFASWFQQALRTGRIQAFDADGRPITVYANA